MIGKRVRNASTAQVSAANGNVFGRGGWLVVAVPTAVPASLTSSFKPGPKLWLRLIRWLSYCAMGSAVDFEDIFAEAEGALPPVFPKDRYVQARAPADAQRAHPSGRSTLTPSHLFTLSIATVVFIAVYWIYSFLTDLGRRQRDSFFQLCVILRRAPRCPAVI